MQKVKVTKVVWKENTTGKGDWQWKVGILTEQVADRWYGAFEDKYNSTKLRAITEGSEIEIVITQKGDFYNFKFPTKTDYLEARVNKIEEHVFGNETETASTPQAEDVTEPEPSPDDIPF